MKTIFFLLLILPLSTIHAQTVPYSNNPSAGKYYPIQGIQYYVETYGSGKPLILLHGNGGSIASMSSIIPYFSKKYQVITIDSRAQGKSIDTQDSLSFEMIADDVSGLLEKLKITKTDIIGWSDGGIVALEMAIRHPKQVNKLAVTGANITPDSTAFAKGIWLDDKRYYDSVKNIPRTTPAEKKAWKLFLLDWNQPNISLEELHHIAAPSLIICGDHDLISLEHTIKIFRNIPQAQLWVVPNSSHGTLIEHPKEFCEAVDKFLDGGN